MFETNELKMFNQGFVVYETLLSKRKYFFAGVVHDYALLYLDNVYAGTLDRSSQTTHNFTIDCQLANCTLKIVVEAMGHINFDHQM